MIASRAISRRTGSKPETTTVSGRVVDDQVDARRLLERPDVAALAADDPALHLVARQVEDRDRVLGGVVRGDPLDRRHDDLAGAVLGLVAGAPLDRLGELDGVVLGLLADGLEEDALGVLGGQPADALEGDDLLLVGLHQLLARPIELALAVDQLAIAALEHVGPLVELLVALEDAPLEVRELVALRPGLVLGLALEPDLLLFRLEDQVLLLAAGLLDDQGGLLVGLLHRPAGEDAAHHESEDNADGSGRDRDHRHEDGIHLLFLPPDRMTGRRSVINVTTRDGRIVRSDRIGAVGQRRGPPRIRDAFGVWR